MLDLAEMSLPPELATVGDFWLIDGDRVVLMHYNTDRTFAGGELLDPSISGRYRDAASVAWGLGRDLTTWWADRPQHRRSVTGRWPDEEGFIWLYNWHSQSQPTYPTIT